MSSSIWTRAALRSSASRISGRCWRVVEAQHRVSTIKITDTIGEQAILETILDQTKPAVPDDLASLHFLLFTPFRYSASNPFGSRFRRPYAEHGVFYASEHPFTAIAETAFYRVLFYAESPATPWPANAGEHTAFACAITSDRVSDIARKPFLADARLYDLADHAGSQAFADAARAAGFDMIRYRSVRDPDGRANLALLSSKVFAKSEPVDRQTWKLLLDRNGVRALCEAPAVSLQFGRDAFAADPRLTDMVWERGRK